ncbi:MAG: zf-HC2 domain-containing protein [Planctomycetota bacterium]
MRCSKVRESLADYLRASLPDGRLRRIQRHLAGCAECAREAREAAFVEDALAAFARKYDAPADPAHLDRETARILALAGAGFGEAVLTPGSVQRFRLPLAAAAAVALAVGLAWAIVGTRPTTPAAPETASFQKIRRSIQDDRILERMEILRGALEGTDPSALEDLNTLRFVLEMALRVPPDEGEALEIVRSEAENEDALDGIRKIRDTLRDAGRADLDPSVEDIRRVFEAIMGVS